MPVTQTEFDELIKHNYTPRELANHLGLTAATITGRLHAGTWFDMGQFQYGNRWWIPRSRVAAWERSAEYLRWKGTPTADLVEEYEHLAGIMGSAWAYHRLDTIYGYKAGTAERSVARYYQNLKEQEQAA